MLGDYTTLCLTNSGAHILRTAQGDNNDFFDNPEWVHASKLLFPGEQSWLRGFDDYSVKANPWSVIAYLWPEKDQQGVYSFEPVDLERSGVLRICGQGWGDYSNAMWSIQIAYNSGNGFDVVHDERRVEAKKFVRHLDMRFKDGSTATFHIEAYMPSLHVEGDNSHDFYWDVNWRKGAGDV